MGQSLKYPRPGWRTFLVAAFASLVLSAVFIDILYRIDGVAGVIGAFVFGVVVSPMMSVFIRAVGEPFRMLKLMFNKQTTSWAWMYGDTLFLPLSLAAIKAAWDMADPAFGSSSLKWIAAAAVVSVAATITFGEIEARNYSRSGHADRLRTPSKRWHDYVIVPVLVFCLLFGGMPLVIWAFDGWQYIVLLILTLAGVAGWSWLIIKDLHRGLQPDQMHPTESETVLARIR